MKERIRELAEQAGFVLWSDCDWKPRGEVIDWASNYDKELGKFAELVRADEREACAKVCEEWGAWNSTAQDCAAAIRSRGDASDISQEPVDKTAKSKHEPWVKTYCGGKPNYTTQPEDIYDIWVEQEIKEKNVPQP